MIVAALVVLAWLVLGLACVVRWSRVGWPVTWGLATVIVGVAPAAFVLLTYFLRGLGVCRRCQEPASVLARCVQCNDVSCISCALHCSVCFTKAGPRGIGPASHTAPSDV